MMLKNSEEYSPEIQQIKSCSICAVFKHLIKNVRCFLRGVSMSLDYKFC